MPDGPQLVSAHLLAVERVRARMPRESQLVVDLMLGAGLRLEEALQLRVGDVVLTPLPIIHAPGRGDDHLHSAVCPIAVEALQRQLSGTAGRSRLVGSRVVDPHGADDLAPGYLAAWAEAVERAGIVDGLPPLRPWQLHRVILQLVVPPSTPAHQRADNHLWRQRQAVATGRVARLDAQIRVARRQAAIELREAA